MSVELLLCPFCGGAPLAHLDEPEEGDWTQVLCEGCPVELYCLNAFAAWNRRTQPNTPPPNLTEHEARIWRYNRGEIK